MPGNGNRRDHRPRLCARPCFAVPPLRDWGIGTSRSPECLPAERGNGHGGGMKAVPTSGTSIPMVAHTTPASLPTFLCVCVGGWTAKPVKRPPQQPAQPPIRQLLGAADAQTAPPAIFSTAPAHQTTGLRERENDTGKSTGRSGRQNAATRRNMRREERVTVQGPGKKQRPDGMSHGGGGRALSCDS